MDHTPPRGQVPVQNRFPGLSPPGLGPCPAGGTQADFWRWAQVGGSPFSEPQNQAVCKDRVAHPHRFGPRRVWTRPAGGGARSGGCPGFRGWSDSSGCPLAMPIRWSKCQHRVGATFAHVHACACVYVSVCPSVRAHEPVCAHPELVWARTAIWVGVRGRADMGSPSCGVSHRPQSSLRALRAAPPSGTRAPAVSEALSPGRSTPPFLLGEGCWDGALHAGRQ